MGNVPTNNDEQSPVANGARRESAVASSVEEGLGRIRKRLLDLTKRNPLLNYRHPKRSCIRIVNAGMELVFKDLLGNPADGATQHKVRFQAFSRRPKREPPEAVDGNGAHQMDVLEDAKNS